jgi:membrane dipeptidase
MMRRPSLPDLPSHLTRPHLTRRDFLAASAGAALLGWSRLRALADEPDPRTKQRLAQILAKTIAIDMHNHVYPAGTEPHPHWGGGGGQGGNQGGGQGGPPAQTPPPPNLSLAQELSRSGFTAVCASFVLDFADNQKPGDARDHLLAWFAAIDAQLEAGHIRRALNLKDLEAAHLHHAPTIIQTVEGAMFLEGQLSRVEEVYRRGLRHLQLLHERDDAVAPLGDVNTAAARHGGLTPFGADVIRECNRLGIVVDMAHAGRETLLASLKVSAQPVIVSHTNLDTWTGANARMAQMMKPRLISRELARAVADAEGMVGVWTHLTDSLPEFVQSLRAMTEAIGVEHTGIGTDTDLLSARDGQGTNHAYPGLTQPFFAAIAGEMLRQGFTPDEIGKIGGGNYCRIFGKVTAAR